MSRVTTTNYGADPTTQFAWATTDGDFFDREDDLYNLSQAVEFHDHSAGRGLEVARVAANGVGTDAYQALSVTTDKLANGAVTNAKLGSAVVGYGNLSFPLIQSSDAMAGGFRLRNNANTYSLGFYMAANGLAVFGAGNATSPGSNLILGQTGQVSVGAAQGAAAFNILQTGVAIGSGLRVYNPNTAFYSDLYQDTNGVGVLSNVTSNCIWFSGGRVAIGALNFSGMLTIVQPGNTVTDGLFMIQGGGQGAAYIDSSGHWHLQSVSSFVMLNHSGAIFGPASDGGTNLGASGQRWNAFFCVAMTCSTTAAFQGAVTMSSTLQIGGALSGVTTLAMAGTLTGVTSLTMNGALSGVTNLSISGGLSGATTGSFSSSVSVGGNLTITGELIGNTSRTLIPANDTLYNLGSTVNKWANIYSSAYWKPGGGNGFLDPSDDVLKKNASFRPYTKGLADILLLRPTYFEFTGDWGTPPDTTYVGFRAQELQRAAPEMVGKHVRSRTLPNGKTEEREFLHVDSSHLTYMMLNAIQELHAKIEDLQAQLKDRSN